MSQYQDTNDGQEQPQGDAFEDTVVEVVKGVGALLLAAVALPLLVPALALLALNVFGPTRARYWLVPRWWIPAAVLGVVAVGALLAWEVVQIIAWAGTPAAAAFFDGGIGAWWPRLWEASRLWLVVNLAAGVLLVPVVWSWSRRRTAKKVYNRQIDDVVVQEKIERARATAADWTAARRIRVRMNPRTGKFARQRRRVRLAGPLKLRRDTWAVGLVTRPTVRTWPERTVDVRTAPDWTDPAGRWFVVPQSASAVRALLLAESGTGKTVLLVSIIRAAAAMGWPVVMIDAKGDPADAHELAGMLRGAGRRVAVAPKWNLFSGSGDQITERLMRLLPPAEGPARHYADEARNILGLIQERTPLRSIEDLADRLRDPAPHVRDAHDLAEVTAIVDSRTKQTAGARVAKSLSAALRPLAPYLAAEGWSYREPGADVVVVPLAPVDTAQARLGDLMLMSLRQHMADRLQRGDKTPALMIVDEFPQLVTEDTDPGDVAAALFETARSAGLGLILAGQSVAGLSADEAMRKRALSSGAGLILGRSKDPEDVVKLAGTVMRMEASGEAHGVELRSGRAQHTYVIPPQEVREAWNGRFWLIHAGAIAPFRVLPPAPAGEPPATPAGLDDEDQAPAVEPEPAPVVVETPEPTAETVAVVAALDEAADVAPTTDEQEPSTGAPDEPQTPDERVSAPVAASRPPEGQEAGTAAVEDSDAPEAPTVAARRPAPRGFSATRNSGPGR